MSTKLGNYIKDLRGLKKKSLRQVEAEAGISNAHLSQIEKGGIEKPSLDLLEKLSEYFQVDLAHLKSLAGYSIASSIVPDSKLIPLKFITATQLHAFSDNKDAEGLLPELVRDLIISTINCAFLKMPIGSSVFMHGWDGLLSCEERSRVQFVPEGFSCWEMSRTKNVTKKFEQDFAKRTKKSLGQSVENSTYVQVTFRRLGETGRVKLVESLKKTGSSWKDIKLIDAEDLELWLERSPIVALSYAKRMGLFPTATGLVPLNDFWGKWWAATEPAIDQSMLLEAGKRCDGAFGFIKEDSFEHLKIKSNDIEVGIAFFYAAISSVEDKVLAQSLISRSMIVESEDAFRLLATRGRRLILIPTFKGAPIGEAKVNGHRIVSIVNNFNAADLGAVGRVRTSVMAEFLKVEGGYSNEKAYRVAQSCFGNLAILRRMLAAEGEVAYPIWSKSEYGSAVLPLVLLGGWSPNNENDRVIVERAGGKTYSEIESYLDSIPEDNERLFLKTNGSYSFYQEYDYTHLYKFLNDKVLESFFEIAKEVLCDIDTKFDLPSADRYAASIYKKGTRYSGRLRTGIATSLAMLANMNQSALPGLESRIDNLIGDILREEKDWKFWASLSDILTLLAESSPNAFLSKLQKVCSESEFVEIFKQTTTMGGCDYSSLLWSLELCAWDRQYFKQVSKILMTLADFENKANNYVNQPSKSLRDIYRPWLNQSSVPFLERVGVLKELESYNPKQVWMLLLRLVPSSHEVCDYNYRPRFRDVDSVEPSGAAEVDYITVMNALMDYILLLLEKDPLRWIDALDLVFRVRPRSYQTRMIDALLALNNAKLSDDAKLNLWRALEKESARHIEFPDAEWSVKSSGLSKLKRAYSLLIPPSPVQRWVHIFDYSIMHPATHVEDHDYKKKEEATRALQRTALKEILSESSGLDILESLIQTVPSPWILGSTFAEVCPDNFLGAVRVAKGSEKGKEFIHGLSFSLYRVGGATWLEATLQDAIFSESILRATLYLSVPFNCDVWKKVETESADLQEAFWRAARRLVVLDKHDDAVYVINKFLKYERPLDAFFVLANFEKRGNVSLSTELCMTVLDAVMGFDFGTKDKEHDFGLFDYHLEELLKELETRADADKRRLALIEWNFLPLFKFRKRPENLTQEVNRDPKLFIDILKLAYKKDDLTSDGETNKALVSRAYQFLHDNKTVPGLRSDGSFGADEFQNWFSEARSLAGQCDRIRAFDSVMGQLLAYSPFDPEDGSWPHKSIRDVFERYNSKELENGLSTGVFNKRGVFTKSMGEGGTQERQLSKKYAEYAKASELSWPRVSKVLRDLENIYSVDAHRADVRAFSE